MTVQEIDQVLTRIAVMDRPALLQEIRAFSDPFRLDFSDAYIARQDTERLRHILMAAYLQHKRHARAPEPCLQEA